MACGCQAWAECFPCLTPLHPHEDPPGATVPPDRSRFPSLTSWRSSGLDFRQEMRLTSEPPLHSPSLHCASVSSNVPWASHTILRVVGTAAGGCISGLLVQLWYGTRATLLPKLHGGLSWGRVLEPGVRTKCSEAEPWLPLGQQSGSSRHWPL